MPQYVQLFFALSKIINPLQEVSRLIVQYYFNGLK